MIIVLFLIKAYRGLLARRQYQTAYQQFKKLEEEDRKKKEELEAKRRDEAKRLRQEAEAKKKVNLFSKIEYIK